MKKFIAKHPVLAVFSVALLMLAPVMSLRDFSVSNELRYLSIVDEMIRDGNIFALYNHGLVYADKPPLYFWLLALCHLILGKHSIFAASLISFLPALGIAVIMDKWVTSALSGNASPSERAAFSFLLLGQVLFIGTAVFVRMDMLMTFFIVLSLYTFLSMYKGKLPARRGQLLLPLWIFLALFTKGPVGILMPIVVILVFLIGNKEWKLIPRYLGWRTWTVLAVLCAAWFTAVYFEGGKEYLNNLLFHQTIDRAVNSFDHKAPVWFYFAYIWITSLPFCFLLVPSVVLSLKDRKGRTPDELLMAEAVVSVVVMLSMFSSKLFIYLLPVFPFLAYLFPLYVRRTGWKKWMSISLYFSSALYILVGIGGLALPLYESLIPDISSYTFLKSPFIFITAALFAAAGVASLLLFKRKSCWAGISVLSAAILAAALAFSPLMPQANDYIGYRNVASLVPDNVPVSTLGVRRVENIDVFLPGSSLESYGNDISSFLSNPPEEGAIIIKTSILEGNERLKSFCSDNESVACGPFTVVLVK